MAPADYTKVVRGSNNHGQSAGKPNGQAGANTSHQLVLVRILVEARRYWRFRVL